MHGFPANDVVMEIIPESFTDVTFSKATHKPHLRKSQIYIHSCTSCIYANVFNASENEED